jgi:hypothetical protein
MEKITNSNGLKDAIYLLEQEQIAKGKLLKEQLYLTYEGYKPVNIFKKTLSEAVTSPHLMENIVLSVMGLTSGYFSKKLIVGASGGIMKKLFGAILQFGVTKVIVRNPNVFKSVGHVIGRLFTKRPKIVTDNNL